jgi:mono/diheme cytochrome c family protein
MFMRASRLITTFVVAVALAAGCSNGSESPSTISSPPPVDSSASPVADGPPPLDPALVGTGAELYAELCASCHGADLTGAENWQVPNPDGSYPPPPQDSSGHTWHHGDDLLVDLILEGSGFPQSQMPAFRGRLTEPDVLAVLEFFKSRWGSAERELQWEVTLREGDRS